MTEIHISYFSAAECLLVACGDRQLYLPIDDERSWEYLVAAVKRWTVRQGIPLVEDKLDPQKIAELVFQYKRETTINLEELDL